MIERSNWLVCCKGWPTPCRSWWYAVALLTLSFGADGQDTFHTLLDEALIVAIASDYNLADSASYAQAHTTLEGLASDVPSEEATGFNASGITDATPTTSGTSGVQEPSSTDFSSSSGAEVPSLTSFDNNSDEDKESVLRGMFADLKEYDVRYALSKAGGDFQTALDDLLNVQYLASTGQQVKGIDGFFEPSGSKKKKKRGKGSGRGSPAEGKFCMRRVVILFC